MDYTLILERVRSLKPVQERIVRDICKKVQEIFIQQSNLVAIPSPTNIVGDIHGQFYDLLKLLSLGGQPPSSSYVFVGDFVDRGYNSLQTILYLFLLKIIHPDRIYLLRGNHESSMDANRSISYMYGFNEEVNKKYGNSNVWKYCNDTFDYLPIAALVDEIFCVHGGLSPDIHAVDQIRQINRKLEIPTEGPFSDLMWSDPEEIENWSPGHRGAGWLFGYRVVNQFNHHNSLKLIARAHQLAQEGFVYWFEKKNLITVWSAPNYCYRCNNKASYLKVNDDNQYQTVIYEEDERSRESSHYRNVIPYFL